ncbi:MAG: PEP-CTERM sorting domain-containing protein [Pirellulales bacterium]
MQDSGGDPRLANLEDHDAFGNIDPGQVVSWDGLKGAFDGNSGSTNAFDFPVESIPNGSGQVDALANHGDFLFKQVVNNEASLLFSVTGDLDSSSTLPNGPVVAKAHIHYEDPVGGQGVWAEIEAGTVGSGPGPGVNHHAVADLDGLEVWGPEPPSHTNPNNDPVSEGYLNNGSITADADRFSLDNDSSTGFSVFSYDVAAKSVSGYIPFFDIVTAVEKLFLGDGSFSSETRLLVDVDATMVRDVGEVGRWDVGDELLFSIDPIDQPLDVTGAPLPSIDGGEIIHLENTAAGLLPSFLKHGGHVWDTAFDVAGTFGYYFEDIDALEAVGTLDGTEIDTPEPATLALLIFGLAALPLRRQR